MRLPTFGAVSRAWKSVVWVTGKELRETYKRHLNERIQQLVARNPSDPVHVVLNLVRLPTTVKGAFLSQNLLPNVGMFQKNAARTALCGAKTLLAKMGNAYKREPHAFHVAVHIRRGDVGPTGPVRHGMTPRMGEKEKLARELRMAYGRAYAQKPQPNIPDFMTEIVNAVGLEATLQLYEHTRYTPTAWYRHVLPVLESVIPRATAAMEGTAREPRMHIFYEDFMKEHGYNFSSEVIEPMAAGHPNWRLYNSRHMDAATTMAHLLLADLVVVAHSTFSSVTTRVVPRCSLQPGPPGNESSTEFNYQLSVPVAAAAVNSDSFRPFGRLEQKFYAWLSTCLAEQQPTDLVEDDTK